eukprot:g4440.t1
MMEVHEGEEVQVDELRLKPIPPSDENGLSLAELSGGNSTSLTSSNVYDKVVIGGKDRVFCCTGRSIEIAARNAASLIKVPCDSSFESIQANRVALSYDGITLAVSDIMGQISLYDMRTVSSVSPAEKLLPFVTIPCEEVKELVWSQSHLVSLSLSGTLVILDADGAVKSRLPQEGGAVTRQSVCCCPEGQHIAVGRSDGSIEILTLNDSVRGSTIIPFPKELCDVLEVPETTKFCAFFVSWLEPNALMIGYGYDDEDGDATHSLTILNLGTSPETRFTDFSCLSFGAVCAPDEDADTGAAKFYVAYCKEWQMALIGHNQSSEIEIIAREADENDKSKKMWTSVKLSDGFEGEFPGFCLGVQIMLTSNTRIPDDNPAEEPLPPCPVVLVASSEMRLHVFTLQDLRRQTMKGLVEPKKYGKPVGRGKSPKSPEKPVDDNKTNQTTIAAKAEDAKIDSLTLLKRGLVDLYKLVAPAKVDTVPAIMTKYKGQEVELVKRLRKKYKDNVAAIEIIEKLPEEALNSKAHLKDTTSSSTTAGAASGFGSFAGATSAFGKTDTTSSN